MRISPEHPTQKSRSVPTVDRNSADVLSVRRALSQKVPLPHYRRLLQASGVGDGASAYRQAIDLLGLGLACSTFLSSGISFALLVALPFYLFSRDMRFENKISFTCP